MQVGIIQSFEGLNRTKRCKICSLSDLKLPGPALGCWHFWFSSIWTLPGLTSLSPASQVFMFGPELHHQFFWTFRLQRADCGTSLPL